MNATCCPLLIWSMRKLGGRELATHPRLSISSFTALALDSTIIVLLETLICSSSFSLVAATQMQMDAPNKRLPIASPIQKTWQE